MNTETDQRIAVTRDGRPIYAPAAVRPGEAQAVGILSTGEAIWPTPPGAVPADVTQPFGVLATGELVWTLQSRTRLFSRVPTLVAAVLVLVLVGGAGTALALRPSSPVSPVANSSTTEDVVCAGPEYEDFKAHLASRGGTATCADFKETMQVYEDIEAAPEAPSMYEVCGAEVCGDGVDPSTLGADELAESDEYSELGPAIDPSQTQTSNTPNVVGLSGAEAVRRLEDAGLRAATYVPAAGTVTSQAPQAGTAVRAGSAVSLTYSDAGAYAPNSSNQGSAGGYDYGGTGSYSGGSNSSNQGSAGGYDYGGTGSGD